MTPQQIVSDFFENHPDQKDGVLRAFYAYQTHHPRHHEGAHDFSGPWRDCTCRWCGRSREQVRWDDLPPECQHRPELSDIELTIQGEEKKAFALLEKAEKEVSRLVERMGMSGNTLAILHHTHGYDPETVASIVSVPRRIMEDYHADMEKERERSRSAIVRKPVTVQKP